MQAPARDAPFIRINMPRHTPRAAFLCLLWAGTALHAVEPEVALPPYRPATSVTGSIISVGSDTLNNLMTLWAECFKIWHPNVNLQIEGKGPATAPPRTHRRHLPIGANEPTDEAGRAGCF